jgi:thiol-disulfide isomerase/thioredoxin
MMGQDAANSQSRHEISLSNKIVLFGAHWCAPCRGEYRTLPALVAAAAPSRVLLAWIDRSIALPPAILRQNIEILDVLDAQALADRIGGEGYGLPFSAIFDSDGRLCGVWRRLLRPEDIETLKSSCRRGASIGKAAMG